MDEILYIWFFYLSHRILQFIVKTSKILHKRLNLVIDFKIWLWTFWWNRDWFCINILKIILKIFTYKFLGWNWLFYLFKFFCRTFRIKGFSKDFIIRFIKHQTLLQQVLNFLFIVELNILTRWLSNSSFSFTSFKPFDGFSSRYNFLIYQPINFLHKTINYFLQIDVMNIWCQSSTIERQIHFFDLFQIQIDIKCWLSFHHIFLRVQLF